MKAGQSHLDIIVREITMSYAMLIYESEDALASRNDSKNERPIGAPGTPITRRCRKQA
jgi:hypothetical protein